MEMTEAGSAVDSAFPSRPLTNFLVHLGLAGRVVYIACVGLAGPGAGRHSRRAAEGVEPGLQDSWEGVHSIGQGSRVPGHGRWLREVALDQAAQGHCGAFGSGPTAGGQGKDRWGCGGGCKRRRVCELSDLAGLSHLKFFCLQSF